MALCADCLSEAVIQVVSPEGVPVATLCAEDFEAHCQMSERITQMLEDACAALDARLDA